MTTTISNDPALLDIDLIHRFLCDESGWANGIDRATVQKSIRHSLCFGLYENDAQIGFARVTTDYATSASLCDVFIVAAQRGRGLSRRLIEAVLAHPDLQGLRRFSLASSTARGLYQKFGWTALSNPSLHMERFNPDVYRRGG